MKCNFFSSINHVCLRQVCHFTSCGMCIKYCLVDMSPCIKVLIYCTIFRFTLLVLDQFNQTIIDKWVKMMRVFSSPQNQGHDCIYFNAFESGTNIEKTFWSYGYIPHVEHSDSHAECKCSIDVRGWMQNILVISWTLIDLLKIILKGHRAFVHLQYKLNSYII